MQRSEQTAPPVDPEAPRADGSDPMLVAVTDQLSFERELMQRADSGLRQQAVELDERRLARASAKQATLQGRIDALEEQADLPASAGARRTQLLAQASRLRDAKDNADAEIAAIRQRIAENRAPTNEQESEAASSGAMVPERLKAAAAADAAASAELDRVAHRRLQQQPLSGSASSAEESDGDEQVSRDLDDGIESHYVARLTQWARRRIRRRQRLEGNSAALETLSLRDAQREIMRETPGRPDGDLGDGFRVPGETFQRLFAYQRTTLRWLLQLHREAVGGILGDEMGLGKTVQTIAFLSGLHYSRLLRGPILVVCPATVLRQWVSEFHAWWPPFRVVVLHATGAGMEGSGTGAAAADAQRRALLERVTTQGHVVVTTYSAIRLHREVLLPVRWAFAVLDEGHKIRNPDADVTVCCKQLQTAHRLVLSGTPIQNNLTELWSLCDFVFPGRLGTLPVFQDEFATPIALGGYANASHVQIQAAYKCAVVLRDLVNPYLLRRLKVDVAADLPEKSEQVLFVRLTPLQARVYREFLASRECEAILGGRRHVLYGIDILRKICNHADLLAFNGRASWSHSSKAAPSSNKKRRGPAPDSSDDAEEVEYGDMQLEDSDDDHAPRAGMSFRPEELAGLEPSDPGFGNWRKSGKMVVLHRLLTLWWTTEAAEAHKVLLFCQTRQLKTLLAKMLREMQLPFVEMDGTTPVQARMALVTRFNSGPPSDAFVFLLTTRVGGLGINLTGADRVVIFDPDWNPSTDVQARERAWRLGQRRPVKVYRLLTAGAIEEKILHRQIFKTYLASRILRDPKQKRFFKNNELRELFSLNELEQGTETGDLMAGLDAEVRAEPSGDARAPDGEDARTLEWIGVQSALHHDVIMDTNASADPTLAEREAERVAARAVGALRDSRQRLRDAARGQSLARIGAVTWTGRTGLREARPGQAAPRFGARLAASAAMQASSAVGAPAASPVPAVRDEPESSSTLADSTNALSRRSETSAVRDATELSRQIQRILQARGGGARTADLLLDLGDTVDTGNKTLVLAFRRILRSLATLRRPASGASDGDGVWELKPEFLEERVD